VLGEEIFDQKMNAFEKTGEKFEESVFEYCLYGTPIELSV